MTRRAFTMRLKPNSLEEYKYHHDNIWPELVNEIERAGIASITTFQRDDDLFLVSDIADDDAWDRLWNSEVHKRWAELMHPLMHMREDGIVESHVMTEIFHLTTSGGPSPATERAASEALNELLGLAAESESTSGRNGSAAKRTKRGRKVTAKKTPRPKQSALKKAKPRVIKKGKKPAKKSKVKAAAKKTKKAVKKRGKKTRKEDTAPSRMLLMLELLGKTAVVTGAGRGLGRTVAVGLARCGATLALVARNSTQLEETARHIREAGGVALAIAADVSQVEAIDKLRHRVIEELGTPQILINAAGIFGPIQLVADSDPRRWIETISINVVGPYLTCRAFAAGMIESGWGRIVNFSSAASLHTPGPLNSAYGTSKVALNQFTRHLAAELADSGVTANVIHPGEVKTEMWQAIRDESKTAGAAAEGYRAWAEQVGQTGGDDPQKALELVLELLAEECSTNGQFLWIKGGQQKPIASW